MYMKSMSCEVCFKVPIYEKPRPFFNFNNLSGILKCASNTGELTYLLTSSVQHPGCLSSYSCGSCLFRLIVKFYRDPCHVNLCFL